MQLDSKHLPRRDLRGLRRMQPGRLIRLYPEASPSPGLDACVLHELFEARVDERPGAPAVVIGREATSYAGLDRYANRLARHLRARGVRRGSRVGILLPQTMDVYATILAVLKAGATCVPIDPRQAAERTAFVLADCGAAALVTTTEYVQQHAGFDGSIVQIDLRCAAIAAEDPGRLPADLVRVGPSDPCYVFYTPDGALRPRGVAVEHGNAARLACMGGQIFGVRPWDRVYQGSPISAAASIHETWLAFHAGAALVPRTPRMERSGARLARLLSMARVTVLSCTPLFLSTLSRDVPSLRLLILGGGKCPDDLAARWARTDRRLVSIYGDVAAASPARASEAASSSETAT